ncbi:MAG TPA: gamma-glutamyl-gamma-aminobutyrate hydrolase family protein [Candidatus Saccharimonadales bacterium]|nr:gamma-glutamyl-gamma-aminobutyrate hydrolase family protein [Candidatus Saccharimonadales bacterium]
MKILLINNNTQHLQNLRKSLVGHDVEIQVYKPGLDFRHRGKDLVILSGGGGEGLEIFDFFKRGRLWYEDEMNFVRSCDKPILGICMGYEVIASAYGAKIIEGPQLIEGFKPVKVTKSGQKMLNNEILSQFESHFWRVTDVSSAFEVMAESETGIEGIKHKTKQLFGTQFHPEKGGTIDLFGLLQH